MLKSTGSKAALQRNYLCPFASCGRALTSNATDIVTISITSGVTATVCVALTALTCIARTNAATLAMSAP